MNLSELKGVNDYDILKFLIPRSDINLISKSMHNINTKKTTYIENGSQIFFRNIKDHGSDTETLIIKEQYIVNPYIFWDYYFNNSYKDSFVESVKIILDKNQILKERVFQLLEDIDEESLMFAARLVDEVILENNIKFLETLKKYDKVRTIYFINCSSLKIIPDLKNLKIVKCLECPFLKKIKAKNIEQLFIHGSIINVDITSCTLLRTLSICVDEDIDIKFPEVMSYLQVLYFVKDHKSTRGKETRIVVNNDNKITINAPNIQQIVLKDLNIDLHIYIGKKLEKLLCIFVNTLSIYGKYSFKKEIYQSKVLLIS